jgi:hypothetical protein
MTIWTPGFGAKERDTQTRLRMFINNVLPVFAVSTVAERDALLIDEHLFMSLDALFHWLEILKYDAWNRDEAQVRAHVRASATLHYPSEAIETVGQEVQAVISCLGKKDAPLLERARIDKAKCFLEKLAALCVNE